MKTRKITFWSHVYEYKALEEYIKEMAAEGWIFTGFSRFMNVLKFEKQEPQRIDYYVDFYDGALKSEDADELTVYRSFVEEYGYRFLYGNQVLQVFERTAASLPIRDESEINKSYLRKAAIHELYASFFLLLIGIILCIFYAVMLRDTDFSNNIYFMFVLFWPWVSCAQLVEIIPVLHWLKTEKVSNNRKRNLLYSKLSTCIRLMLLAGLLSIGGLDILLYCLMGSGLTALFAQMEQEKIAQGRKKRKHILYMVCNVILVIACFIGSRNIDSAEDWHDSVQDVPLGEDIATIQLNETVFVKKAVVSIKQQSFTYLQVQQSAWKDWILQQVIDKYTQEDHKEDQVNNVSYFVDIKKEYQFDTESYVLRYQLMLMQQDTLLLTIVDHEPTQMEIETAVHYLHELNDWIVS